MHLPYGCAIMIKKEGKPDMKIMKHYQGNETLRHSFQELAQATFGLDFENWYQMVFWGDDYVPYSVIEDDRVVANVSLNRTDMIISGQRKRLYQLGTVMTAERYRNRGYIRAIMEEIEKDIQDADGVYLFANDSVLEFYPKFGFASEKEFVYTKTLSQSGPCRMENIPMDISENQAKLCQAIEENALPAACRMIGNPGLIFFYVVQFMRDCVYYDRILDAWAIGQLEDGELVLHNVFSARDISLEGVLQAFGSGVKSVILGFTPSDTEGFTCRELKEENCTFFVKGEAFRDFAKKKLRIPSLSHA